jgi:U3 small nucleolar RNA-associated protein 10
MTSLKLQLNKLADAHTQWQLTDSENRKRASFLYDPKVASTLDRETIYCLGKKEIFLVIFFLIILIFFQGTNGFEELCLLDSGFEEFERVLFSDTSLTFERSIQTKEVNDSLNLTIRRFLIRLSPYFLLSPAHKALEWLVHR